MQAEKNGIILFMLDLQCVESEQGADYVLIHDGARPFFDEEIIMKKHGSTQNIRPVWQACRSKIPSKYPMRKNVRLQRPTEVNCG